jgi:curved DNA-binding protein CbpA
MNIEAHSRPLTLSDLAPEQDNEIKNNPYRFLNLPEGAPFTDVRRSYIILAKTYHPDLVNPKLNQSYLLNSYGVDTSDSLERIRTDAYQKMVLINRAYAEIKNRTEPQQIHSINGYDANTKYNSHEKSYQQNIQLEGNGEINVYPSAYEYWVAGPYICFDYGSDNRTGEIDYLHELCLKHLFAHLELKQGRFPAQVLLDPFIDCFKLDTKRVNDLFALFQTKAETGDYFKKLNISNLVKDLNLEAQRGNFESQFIRHINEILYLSRSSVANDFLDYYEDDVSATVEENGEMVLQVDTTDLIGFQAIYGSRQTIFTEADNMLFTTLAYGPLLK